MSENSGPEQSPARLAFVSIKWGRHFSPDYVNVLHHHVNRNVSRKHHFICVTDDAAGLHPAIEAIPLPDLNLSEKRSRLGRWQKLALFKAGLLPDVDVAIYMDLDTMVLGSLDQLVDHVIGTPGFHILREWNPAVWDIVPVRLRPDRGGQSSILGWRPSDQHQIFDEFVRDPEEIYRQVSNDPGTHHEDRRAVEISAAPVLRQLQAPLRRALSAQSDLQDAAKAASRPNRRLPRAAAPDRPAPGRRRPMGDEISVRLRTCGLGAKILGRRQELIAACVLQVLNQLPAAPTKRGR
jgi:hypothetical protein